MVGWGKSAKPSEGLDMTDTSPKKDAIETALDFAKLQNWDGVMYPPNEETPFRGRAENFYENDQKNYEGNLNDGKREGLSTLWYDNWQ